MAGHNNVIQTAKCLAEEQTTDSTVHSGSSGDVPSVPACVDANGADGMNASAATVLDCAEPMTTDAFIY